MLKFFTNKSVSNPFLRPGWILLLLFLSSGIKAQLAGTYSICSACSYSTIGAAVSDLYKKGVKGAVVFNIYGGVYHEHINLSGGISGSSPSNTITFNGNGNGRNTPGSNGTGPTHVYDSANTVYVYATTCVTFQNMIIESISGNTISVNKSILTTFNNNTIRCPLGNKYHAVDDEYNLVNAFSNNYVWGGDVSFYTVNAGSAGTDGYNSYRNNTLVQMNDFGFESNNSYRNVYEGNYVDSAYLANNLCSPFMLYYPQGDTWLNNRFGSGAQSFTNGAGSIFVPNIYDDTKPYMFYNNMINCGPSCVYTMYIVNVSAANVHILHNTFYSASSTYGAFFSDTRGGMEISSNIFYTTSGPAMYYYFYNSPTSKVDGNAYWNGSSGTLLYYGTSTTAYSSFSTYQANAKLTNNSGVHDQNMKPVFISSSDLHLNQSSPAPNGVYVGIGTDIDGDKRCKLFPTSGADESSYGRSVPVVSITGKSSTYAGAPITFYNNAKAGEPKVYAWYIDGVLTDSTLNFTTTKLTAGTHIIKLTTSSCGGSASATFSVKAINPPAVPVSDFISNINFIKQGDTIRLMDISTNGPNAWKWHITPDYASKSSTPPVTYILGTDSNYFNPIVQFNAPGKFKVCLTASNILGTGNTACKVAYIEVLPTYNFADSLVIHDSKGYLYDDGGPTGNYSLSSKIQEMELDPCADSIFLVFNYFSTFCGEDFLRLYEGTDTLGRILNSRCTLKNGLSTGFNGSPASFTCNASGKIPGCYPNQRGADTIKAKGKIHLVFETHIGGYTGWEAYWWSTPSKQGIPKASIASVDSICVNNPVSFISTSTGASMKLRWELNNDFKTDDNDSSKVNWTYTDSGWHTVYLLASNCSGTDTARKKIYIRPVTKPVANFSSNNIRPTTDDIVPLSTANMKTCVSSYEWTIVKQHTYKSGTTPKVMYVSGNNQSAYPYITLPDTGCWDVTLKVTSIVGKNTYTDTKFMPCFFHVKAAYCVPTVSNIVPDLGISGVSLNGIANASAQGINEYENFKNTNSASLEIGLSYRLSVGRKTNVDKATRSVFIDWNGDGDFDDAQEHYADDTNSNALVWNSYIKVPIFAVPGATVMRIAINYGNYSNKPCGQNEYGEYEDYRLYILENTHDKVAPVIKIAGPDTTVTEVFNTVNIPAWISAYDSISGDVSAWEVTDNPVNNTVIGWYKISYSDTDKLGNKAIAYRYVHIIDSIAPLISLKGPDTVYMIMGNKYTDAGIMDSDNYNKPFEIRIDTISNVNTAKPGSYAYSYYATDKSGNISKTVTRTIIVKDTTRPVVTMKGKQNQNWEVKVQYKDPGATAKDNYWTSLKAEIAGTFYKTYPDGIPTKLGTYTIIYRFTDGSGNKDSVIRILHVVDTIAPIVTLKGNNSMTVCRWKQYTDSGYTVSDNYWPATSVKTEIEGTFATFNTSNDGLFSLRYKATDSSGNIGYSEERLVLVTTDNLCASSVNDPSAIAKQVNIYPNPNNGRFSIETNLNTKTQVRIVITDMYGREIALLHNALLDNNRFEVDMSGHASGVYTISIIMDNLIVQKQAVIAR